MSYAIIRNEKYKRENLKGIYRHNERRNKNYSNKNINQELSYLNYFLKDCKHSYEKEFELIREKYNLKGQIKTVSNIVCEYIITSDKEFFNSIGAEETKRYFETAYKFVCDYKNLGEQYILSAKVHMDEKTPHMHIVFIPVVHTKDKKGDNIDKISCSEFWKGKNSYQILQNNFYKYMITCGFHLERGRQTENKHLTIEQLKSVTNYEKIRKEIEKSPIEEINSNSLELVVAENKKLVKHCNRLREYCITSVNIFDKCSEYETEIKNLQQENSSLKEKIKELKSYIKSIFTVLENSFNISKKKLFKLLLQKQKSI